MNDRRRRGRREWRGGALLTQLPQSEKNKKSHAVEVRRGDKGKEGSRRGEAGLVVVSARILILQGEAKSNERGVRRGTIELTENFTESENFDQKGLARGQRASPERRNFRGLDKQRRKIWGELHTDRVTMEVKASSFEVKKLA